MVTVQCGPRGAGHSAGRATEGRATALRVLLEYQRQIGLDISKMGLERLGLTPPYDSNLNYERQTWEVGESLGYVSAGLRQMTAR